MSGNAAGIPSDGLSLAELIAQVDARLDVLRPLVEEFEQLQAARNALTAAGNALPGAAPARGRRAPRAAGAPRAARRGRRAPRGANREAILRVVGERPGVMVADIAEATGIARPTVHSTVYALRRRGVLAAQGDGVRLGRAAPGEAGAPAPPARPAAARSGSAARPAAAATRSRSRPRRASRRRSASRARSRASRSAAPRASRPAAASAPAAASTPAEAPKAPATGGAPDAS